jgi:hypothetical protein
MGFTCSIATEKGAKVTGLDYCQDCVTWAQLNSTATIVKFNWFHDLPPTLVNQFDLLIGSDVLYLRNALSSIVKCIDGMVTDKGMAILVDPGRPNIEEFVSKCQDAGLSCTVYHKQNHILFHGQVMERVNVLLISRHDYLQDSPIQNEIKEILCKMNFLINF